jgi:Caleosin related protein
MTWREERERSFAASAKALGQLKLTALQKHCAFFDRRDVGQVTLMDSAKGFYACGLNVVVALIAAILIQTGMAWWTSSHW